MNRSFIPQAVVWSLFLVALPLLPLRFRQMAAAMGPAQKKQPEAADHSAKVPSRRSTNLQVKLTGPPAILALRDELQLTDEQVRRLQAMVGEQGHGSMTKEKNGPPKRKPPTKTAKTKTPDMKAKIKKMMGGGEKPTEMSPAMMLRCRLAMELPVSAADPAAALTLRGPLKLTDEQAARLERVRDRARKRTQRILNQDQRRKLRQVVPSPTTAGDLYVKMLEAMQKMMGKMSAGERQHPG